MKKTAKILSLILALLMMAMVMFACNSDGAGDEDDDDAEEKTEEKYVNLTPEGVYNKVSKAKNVKVSYVLKSENFENVSTVIKDSNNLKLVSERKSSDGNEEITYYYNLSTKDYYRQDDDKWYYEKDEEAKDTLEQFIALNRLESQFGKLFTKENAFESDNYTYADNVYTYKSDLLSAINDEEDDVTYNSFKMVRDGSVYTYTANVTEGDETGTVEVIVDFNKTEVKFPENAIEIKYAEYIVTVKDVNGNPINDVEVEVYSGEDYYEDWEYVDEQGKADFDLIVGKDYYIHIKHYGEAEYEIDEKYYFDGTSANITLAEKEKICYEVTVKDYLGNPISGIDVSLYRTDNDSYVDYEYTDENGHVEFKFDESAGYYVTLYGSLDMYVLEDKYYFTADEPLEIILAEKPAYVVTITDSDGNPCENFQVVLYDASGNYIMESGTDEFGVARIVVEQNYNYVYAEIRNYTGVDKYIIEDTYSFASGSKEMSVVLAVKEAITVRVMNTAGDAIYNVRVFLRDKNGYSWDWESYYYTNSDGYVFFYDFDTSKELYITIDNVPSVYSYEESYTLEGNTLTIYLSPKA